MQPRSTACEPGLGIAAVRCTCCVGCCVGSADGENVGWLDGCTLQASQTRVASHRSALRRSQ